MVDLNIEYRNVGLAVAGVYGILQAFITTYSFIQGEIDRRTTRNCKDELEEQRDKLNNAGYCAETDKLNKQIDQVINVCDSSNGSEWLIERIKEIREEVERIREQCSAKMIRQELYFIFLYHFY
jgi:hypothetical protein